MENKKQKDETLENEVDDVVGILTAISVVSKRLAKKIKQVDEQDGKEEELDEGQNSQHSSTK